MSESAFPLSLDELTNPDAEGARVRDMIAQAARVGTIKAESLIMLAEVMHAKGQAGMVFWILGVALTAIAPERIAEVSFERMALTAAGLPSHSEDPVGPAAGREAFFAAIDAMEESGHTQCMTRLVSAMADEPEAARMLADGGGGCEVALGLRLAACLFNADIEAARKVDAALARLSNLRRWTWIARIKLALADEVYERAAKQCRAAIAAVGADAQLTCLMSVSQFCLGNRSEGHRWAERAGEFFAADHIALRQGQIRDWAEQLEHAMRDGLEDGGAEGRIGSFELYAKPSNVTRYYADHRRECVPENVYRTMAGWTNQVMFGAVERFLAAEMGITKIINFGTLCGVLEHGLSARYPKVHWVGYDYSPLATEKNRAEFRRGNLTFHQDLDAMFAELAELPGEALLIHCRTTDVMLPAAVKRLYRRCHDAGVRYLFSAEYFCRSMVTLRFPDFTVDPLESVHWDGILMVHNYDRLFADTGYRLVSSAMRPVPLLVSMSGEGMALDQMIETVFGERISA